MTPAHVFKARPPQPAPVIKARIGQLVTENKSLPDNWRATTLGVLQHACKGEANRHSVLMYLFGKTSSKALTGAEWFALYAWVFPHHLDSCPAFCGNSTDTWHCHNALPQEINGILTARLVEMGQTELPL